jgi:hypothetical protein
MNTLEWFAIVILPALVVILSWGAYDLTRPRRNQDRQTRAH